MNEDCPINDIISTEQECIEAAGQQPGEYKYRYNFVNRPAGCFTYTSSGNTYFNEIIDPSVTSPTNGAAGLCKAGSIFKRIRRPKIKG